MKKSSSVPGRGVNTSKGTVSHTTGRSFSRDFQNTEVECKCCGGRMKSNQEKAGEEDRAGSRRLCYAMLRGGSFCCRPWRAIYRLSAEQRHGQSSLSERIFRLSPAWYNSRDAPHIGCQGM